MKRTIALLLPALLLAACAKKEPQPAAEAAPATPPAAAPAPAPAATPEQAPPPAPAPAAAPAVVQAGSGPLPTPVISTQGMSSEQKETARRQGQLDFSNMEEGFLTDPNAQWAKTAQATSDYSRHEVTRAVGKIDGEYWSSKNSDVGFDSLEAAFEKPVNATLLRVAVDDGYGLDGITKIELQDVDGKWNTVWSGVHNVKRDERGRRTWLVLPIEKTAYKAKAARITKSNNMTSQRLTVDAVQLVGV